MADTTTTTYQERNVTIEEIPENKETLKLSLSVDIESMCDSINGQSMIAVGWVVGDVNTGKVYEKSFVALSADNESKRQAKRYERQRKDSRYIRTSGREATRHKPYDWLGDKRCIEEFWLKFAPEGLLPLLASHAKAPEVAMAEFLAVEGRWNIKQVISDNPSYDLTRIDLALRDYTDHHFGMHYTADGSYRKVDDPSQQIKSMPQAFQDEIWKRTKSVGGGMTHRPDDDAYDIFMMAVLAKRSTEYLKEAFPIGHPDVSKAFDDVIAKFD